MNSADRLPVTIRPARDADLPMLIALERASFTSHAISDRQMRFLVRNPRAVFLVARIGENIAGNAIGLLRHHPGGRVSGRIYSVVVDANYRGQQVGKKLMLALLSDMARRGATRIFLEVEKSNTVAIGLYQRLGFRSTKPLPHYYGRAKHGVHMLRDDE